MPEKPNVIQYIKEKTGIILKVSADQLLDKDSWGVRRSYSLREDGKLIGLNLDYVPGTYFHVEEILNEIHEIEYLSMRNGVYGEVTFLQQLKNLSSLNLSRNTLINDYSFLQELKGLTSLNLTFSSYPTHS